MVEMACMEQTSACTTCKWHVQDARMARASGAGGSKRCKCKACTMCGRKTWGEHVFKLGWQRECSSTRWLAVWKLIEVDGWMDGWHSYLEMALLRMESWSHGIIGMDG